MNNKFKIILGVFGIIIVYVILVLTGVLPNPFLDTKDLVCKVDNFYPVGEIDLVVTFRFDKKAIIKSYTEAYVYVVEDEEKLLQKKESLIKNNKKFDINGNQITTYNDFYIKKDQGYYGKTKKEIREIYEEEFFYTCE